MSEDENCEYRGPDRRQHCEMVVVLNSKLNNVPERMKALEDGMIALGKSFEELRRPYRILHWILGIITLAFLGELAKWLFELFKNRIHFG